MNLLSLVGALGGAQSPAVAAGARAGDAAFVETRAADRPLAWLSWPPAGASRRRSAGWPGVSIL